MEEDTKLSFYIRSGWMENKYLNYINVYIKEEPYIDSNIGYLGKIEESRKIIKLQEYNRGLCSSFLSPMPGSTNIRLIRKLK